MYEVRGKTGLIADTFTSNSHKNSQMTPSFFTSPLLDIILALYLNTRVIIIMVKPLCSRLNDTLALISVILITVSKQVDNYIGFSEYTVKTPLY